MNSIRISSKKNLLILFISLLSTVCYAQSENRIIDSILNTIEHATNSEKVRSYLIIGQATRNINIDTAFYYDSIGFNLAKEINNDTLLIMGYNNIALDKKQYGNIKAAKDNFNKALNLSIKLKDSSMLSTIYNNLGVITSDVGNYTDALEYYFKALKIDEDLSNKNKLAITYNNIGTIHYNLENFDQALTYYKKSIKLKQSFNDADGVALLLMNIGILYYFKNDYDSVFINFRKAMNIWEGTGNLRRMALIQTNLAEMHIELKEYDEAINYLTNATEIYNQLKEVFDVIHTELLIGDIYAITGGFNSAKKMFDQALKKAKTAKSLSEEMVVYDSYKNMYILKKDYENAYHYQEKYHELKDSLFNNEKATIIQEIETKYETDKVQQQLVLAEKENALNELDKKRLRTIIYFILFGTIMLIVFIALVIKAYKNKRDALIRISEQNKEIIEQRNEIESQRDYANSQKDLIIKQKDAITDSINYALRIQKALIPSNNELNALFKEYFIFYQPKDVVSGDFYWTKQVNNQTIISLADCTGHGVPGALMSMLGMSFLNEITKTHKIENAAIILEHLRENIIKSLRQNEEGHDQIDGMAMAIVIINHNDNTIDYAGASNPLYIISDKEVKAVNPDTKIKTTLTNENTKKIYEIVPDKMPVAKYIKMSKFQHHKLVLNHGDQIIMFSDGYIDQFGGKDNVKYQSAKFKQLLLQHSNKSLSEQAEIIKSEFYRWKGNNDQIDDVSLLSFIFQ